MLRSHYDDFCYLPCHNRRRRNALHIWSKLRRSDVAAVCDTLRPLQVYGQSIISGDAIADQACGALKSARRRKLLLRLAPALYDLGRYTAHKLGLLFISLPALCRRFIGVAAMTVGQKSRLGGSATRSRRAGTRCGGLVAAGVAICWAIHIAFRLEGRVDGRALDGVLHAERDALEKVFVEPASRLRRALSPASGLASRQS